MVEEMKQGHRKFYGWVNVILLFVVYATTMGIIFYGFTYIFPAMIAEEGWKRGNASLAHTIRGYLVGFLAPLVAFSLEKVGARKTLGIGLAVGLCALILLGTVTTRLWQWIVLWGIIMPFVFSLGGMLPVQTTIMYWFNVRRATAMGIVLSSAPAIGFVAAPFYTFIIGKSGTWKVGWLTAAVGCALSLIFTFFIKDKPGDIGQYADGIDPEETASRSKSDRHKKTGTYKTPETWTLKEALRTRVIWLQMVCMLGQAWALYIITVHGVLHLIDKSLSQMQAASVVGNLILFSGIARFPVGILADRIEPRKLSAIGLLGMAIAMFGIWQPPASLTVLLSIAAVYGFCFGITVIVFPLIIANYFGPDAFPPINAFFAPIVIFFGAPVPYLAGLAFDHFKSYDLAFIPTISLLFIATGCAWFLFPPKKKKESSF